MMHSNDKHASGTPRGISAGTVLSATIRLLGHGRAFAVEWPETTMPPL